MMLALAALVINPAARADIVDVFLLGGQSNMLGRAPSSSLPTSPVNLKLAQPDVLFYTGPGGSSVAANTLTTLRPGSGTDIGPEVSFGRSIADLAPSHNIALIKYAAGGTNLYSDWNPSTGVQFANFKSTVAAGLQALINAGHTPNIVGMLWHQGESDADTAAHASGYATRLAAFIAAVRSLYGTNLPFLIGEIHRINANSDTVADAQIAVAAADPYAAFVPASDLTFQDSLHFNTAGQVALGERFADAALDLVFVPEPTSMMIFIASAPLLMRRPRLRKLREGHP